MIGGTFKVFVFWGPLPNTVVPAFRWASHGPTTNAQNVTKGRIAHGFALNPVPHVPVFVLGRGTWPDMSQPGAGRYRIHTPICEERSQ